MLDVLSFLALYVVACIGFNIAMALIGCWNKMSVVMKFPKDKKYETKVDPIYEIREHYGGSMFIHKWSLKYTTNVGGELLCGIFIIYPTEFLFWRYAPDENVYLCEKENLSKYESFTLKSLYEERMDKINEENRLKQEKKNSQNKLIDNFNLEFKQNYN
jgi:hypothetical protein